MGPVHFTQDDFAAWASGRNDRIEGELHERIKDLGEALAKVLRKHKMVSQKRIQDYIGINILADEFAHESVEQVPHWSLALTSKKELTLYIQCESKPLVGKLLKKRERLERSLADKLCAMSDLSNLTLSVRKRLFKLPGGRGLLNTTVTGKSSWNNSPPRVKYKLRFAGYLMPWSTCIVQRQRPRS